MKLVELMKSDKGNESRWFICPSKAFRDLLLRHKDKLVPGCNYVLPWKDVNGWGLQLAIAGWVPKGHVYTVPD